MLIWHYSFSFPIWVPIWVPSFLWWFSLQLLGKIIFFSLDIFPLSWLMFILVVLSLKEKECVKKRKSTRVPLLFLWDIESELRFKDISRLRHSQSHLSYCDFFCFSLLENGNISPFHFLFCNVCKTSLSVTT